MIPTTSATVLRIINGNILTKPPTKINMDVNLDVVKEVADIFPSDVMSCLDEVFSTGDHTLATTHVELCDVDTTTLGTDNEKQLARIISVLVKTIQKNKYYANSIIDSKRYYPIDALYAEDEIEQLAKFRFETAIADAAVDASINTMETFINITKDVGGDYNKEEVQIGLSHLFDAMNIDDKTTAMQGQIIAKIYKEFEKNKRQ